MRYGTLVAACALALCVAPRPAWSLLQSCSVAATPTPFGVYDPSSAIPLLGSGTVTVTCTVTLLGLLDSWTILLSTGSSGTYAARQMSVSGKSLSYNLYTGLTHLQVWGDGTAGTGTVTDMELLVIGTTAYYYTVYGQLSAHQDQPPGTYTDVIVVTVNY